MYQPSIPTGTVNLDIDYQNIQGNFQQLDTTYGTDHVAYSQALNNGYHTVVHLVANSTVASNPPNNYPPVPPPIVPLAGGLYTTQSNDGFGLDEMLWFRGGAGPVKQLTSNFLPVANTNGYTFLPGGLVLQWGVVPPNTNITTTVTFTLSGNIAFANNIFGVQVTRQRPTADPGSSYEFYVDNSTISKTQFQIINRDGHSYGYYWMALGN